jgi:hypothetical protein
VRALTAPLRERARSELATARRGLASAPAEIWPAYGYAALVEPLLNALDRPSADPFAIAAQKPGLAARGRLVIAAARGRI